MFYAQISKSNEPRNTVKRLFRQSVSQDPPPSPSLPAKPERYFLTVNIPNLIFLPAESIFKYTPGICQECMYFGKAVLSLQLSIRVCEPKGKQRKDVPVPPLHASSYVWSCVPIPCVVIPICSRPNFFTVCAVVAASVFFNDMVHHATLIRCVIITISANIVYNNYRFLLRLFRLRSWCLSWLRCWLQSRLRDRYLG